MKTRLFFVLLLLNTVASIAAGDDKELVRNPQFTTAGGDGLPQAWSLWTPAWQQAACRVRAAEGGAVMDAPERPYAVGGLTQELRGVEPGKSYAVRAVARAENLASPLQSLLVRLEWSQAGKPLDAAGMLVRGPKATDGTLKFADVLTAPKQADGARLSLELKWPQGGSVQWEHVSVRETAPLPPRRVKIGTVYLKPNKSTPEQNLELFCGQVDAAGKLGLDIVCLPEAITVVGTGRTVSQVAEAIPGPSTRRLGDAARRTASG